MGTSFIFVSIIIAFERKKCYNGMQEKRPKMEKKILEIEPLLAEGKTVQIKPQGYSMYPMFVPGRDEAVIAQAAPEKLKRGDVVLYRRTEGILVLHRIWRVKQDGFYMVGDNQKEIEGPLQKTQIKGVLTGFIRNGKYVSVHNPIYVAGSFLWLWLRPVRTPLKQGVHRCKKVILRRKNER
jgi:hypothetical protein